jgi:spore coat protein A
MSVPEVRSVVHLHGITVLPFARKVHSYPNEQRATALWYHDHALGSTRLNVYAGVAGMYFIRDKQEASLNLPEDPMRYRC